MSASPKRTSVPRENYARFHALLRSRSRDGRFSVFSASLPAIALTLTLFAVGLGLLAAFADPHVLDIRAALPPVTRPVFKVFSWLGEGILVYVLCLVLVLVSLARDLSAHAPRVRVHDLTRVAASLYVFWAVVAAGLTASLLKFVIGRARPRLFDQVGPYAFDMFGPGSAWASFPSGHTTTVMSCAMAFALLVPRWRVAIIAAGVVISFSRVALGAHYPSDILGGAAFGMLVSWLFARALARRRVVFRFDGAGRLKPLHYLGRAFMPGRAPLH
jgi:membrane-associated phospholipid phosphatase